MKIKVITLLICTIIGLSAFNTQAGGEDRSQEAMRAKLIKSALPKMISIPAGNFFMGDLYDKSNGESDEDPVHEVSVSAFKMSQTEVTFAQWDVCVAAGGCFHKRNDKGRSRGAHPVTNVSYNDITLQFIPWLNRNSSKHFRLPSEAEWEYAARAGSTTKYSWGNSIGNYQANCKGCGSQWDISKTAPVKSFSANAFGLHDMHGNVFEWTQDCWNDSYNGAPSNGSAWLSEDCDRRVLRGGSWSNVPHSLRSANRSWNVGTSRNSSYGFRLVQGR